MKKNTPPATAVRWNKPPWKWLISLQIGIFLLALLILASIIGTLISPLEKAQSLVYYSWWYKALLLLLIINMGAATIHRIAYRIIPATRSRFHASKQFYQGTKPAETITFSGTPESVAASFRSHGYQAAINPEGFGCARKGMWGHWGAPISHAGIILVLLASFAASWTGKEGYLQIQEGNAVDTMVVQTTPPHEVPLGFAVKCDDFETGYFPRTRIPASFISTVTILEQGVPKKTDRVEVNHSVKTHGWTLHQTSYEEVPGESRYRLSVAKAGQKEPELVELSPGQERAVPGQAGTTIQLAIRPSLYWRINQNGKVAAEGAINAASEQKYASFSGMHLKVEQFEPDFVVGQGGQASSRSSELNNPALKVGVYNGSQQVSTQWLFGREDLKSMMHSTDSPFQFDLVRVEGQGADRRFHINIQNKKNSNASKQYTVSLGESVPLGGGSAQKLEAAKAPNSKTAPVNSKWKVNLVETVPAHRTVLTVARNPMIPAIYVGCVIMVLGLLVSFFNRRKTIYFWIDSANQALHAVGIYRNNQNQIDPGTRRILGRLATGQQAEK